MAALDDCDLGADLYGHRVPVICYADDLLSTNAKNLNTMLQPAGDFAQRWRLEFVHPEPDRTKSHCIVFGGELLAEEPRWSLSGQQLSDRQQSEHLGITLDEGLSAVPHVRHRATRARASLYGLAPVGMLATGLCPVDKCFLWRTVVQPALLYGCMANPLSAANVTELTAIQAATGKTALGLPRRAHHTALLAAAGIAPAHELIRAACFRAVCSAMRSEHRRRQALFSGITKLALCPNWLCGSLLEQLLSMCSDHLAGLLEVAAGRQSSDRITPRRAPDGLGACGLVELSARPAQPSVSSADPAADLPRRA